MSANLSSLSVSASPAMQLALNGANEAASASAEISGGIGGIGGNPFAALYQQLLGKQAGLAISPDLLTLPTEAPNTDGGGEAVADLAAMLPFLEAMGLAQAASAPAEQQTAGQAPLEIAAQAIAAAITPQVASQPAISAVKPEAAPDNRLIAEESIVPFTVEKPATAAIETVMPETHHQARDSSAGHEFSSQLATALAANNDLTHHAGNAQHMTANALPQPGLATGTANLPVTQTVGTAAWNDEVGNQVVWMANRMESRAELVLTPPQMGRVEISLSVTGEHATANFVSANPVVREALEAALPRLREILADAGIQLGQTQVGAENARQFAQQQEKNGNNFGNVPSSSATTLDTPNISITPAPAAGLKFGRGLVDVFA